MTEIHDRIRTWWDADAGHYDRSAGHALSDPVQAAAWLAALGRLLPAPPASVLDVGAGTGAISLLAAELGHVVTALDISDAMLAGARAKTEAAGLDVTFVQGRAEEPPPGPFAAVIERHVAWTLPEPVRAMRAWRRSVAPGGRLILFEGSWGGEGPGVAAKDAVARQLARVWGIPEHHHAPYPPDVLRRLPLAGTSSPEPLLRAVREAGWRAARLHRLRDVEWAAERSERWPLGWLTRRPRYAIVADV